MKGQPCLWAGLSALNLMMSEAFFYLFLSRRFSPNEIAVALCLWREQMLITWLHQAIHKLLMPHSTRYLQDKFREQARNQ